MNLVVITCHDLGQFLGCYGYHWVRTPNIDSLAASGVRFENYFCTAPQCSPSRASMWTGHAPHSTGVVGLTHGDFGNDLNADERHFAQIVSSVGYQTHLFGGQHEARTAARCGFDEIHGSGYGSAIETATVFSEAVSELGRRDNAEEARPFFAEIGLFEPHRGFPAEGVNKLTPDKVIVPDFLPDLPEVRTDLAAYEASIATADRAVGMILQALDRAECREHTFVVFSADHGCPFPGAKMTLLDPGLEIPLIIAGPGVKSSVTNRLLSNLAFTPTMLDLLNIGFPVDFHDASFAREILPGNLPSSATSTGTTIESDGNMARHIDLEPAVFAEKTYHTYYDPMRCIRTNRWKLIVNFEFAPTQETPPGETAVYQAVATAEHMVAPEIRRPARHPFLELYDLSVDPIERKNLAKNPEYERVRDDLMKRLRAWMIWTEDPLLNGPVAQQAYVERMERFMTV